MTILKESKKFFQFSIICKNSGYRTLKIELELSERGKRSRSYFRMCLGYPTSEAYLVRVIPSAGLREIIQLFLLLLLLLLLFFRCIRDGTGFVIIRISENANKTQIHEF